MQMRMLRIAMGHHHGSSCHARVSIGGGKDQGRTMASGSRWKPNQNRNRNRKLL